MTASAWRLSVGCLTALLMGSCFDFELSIRPEEMETADSGVPDSDTAIDSNGVRTDSKETGTDSATIGTDSEEMGTDSSEIQIDHPCYDVVCEAPPLTLCTGKSGKIAYYDRERFCDATDTGEPSCEYTEHKESCPGECTDDRCVGAPCKGVYCDTPPSPTCEADALKLSSPRGGCTAEGGCQYPYELLACPNGCSKNACMGDPCAGVICDAPPPRFCYEGNLVVAIGPGSCDDAGQCVYSRKIVSCDAGCTDGRCTGDSPCEYLTCDKPPADYCADEKTLFTFDTIGLCREDECNYTGQELKCTGSCESGLCVP